MPNRLGKPLSPRERQLLGVIVSNPDGGEKAWAYTLGISWITVHHHLENARRKMGVRSTLGLVLKWYR